MSEDFDGAFDLIIAGGTVIDGTRRARFETDVGIVGERIIALGDLSLRNARRRIEAGGKMVAPGFIDSHTHDDVALLSQPLMEYKVSQGVTTVVTGNCGISLAPSRPGMPMPMPLSLLRQEHGDTATFPRFSDYLDALRGAPASVNVAALVGHTTLRAQTMAELNRDATRQERLVMADLPKLASPCNLWCEIPTAILSARPIAKVSSSEVSVPSASLRICVAYRASKRVNGWPTSMISSVDALAAGG